MLLQYFSHTWPRFSRTVSCPFSSSDIFANWDGNCLPYFPGNQFVCERKKNGEEPERKQCINETKSRFTCRWWTYGQASPRYLRFFSPSLPFSRSLFRFRPFPFHPPSSRTGFFLIANRNWKLVRGQRNFPTRSSSSPKAELCRFHESLSSMRRFLFGRWRAGSVL